VEGWRDRAELEFGKFEGKMRGDSGMFGKESGYLLHARNNVKKRWNKITGSARREI
jgi:hypothetical protein